MKQKKAIMNGKLQYKKYNMRPADVDWFWKHMRPDDKRELEIMGATPERVKQLTKVDGLGEAFTARIMGKRVACGGWRESQTVDKGPRNQLMFWFFCTPKFERYILPATKAIKQIIDEPCNSLKYATYRKVIRIWTGHEKAIKWVRLLGFQRLLAYRPLPDGTAILILAREKGKPIDQLINDKYGMNMLELN